MRELFQEREGKAQEATLQESIEVKMFQEPGLKLVIQMQLS